MFQQPFTALPEGRAPQTLRALELEAISGTSRGPLSTFLSIDSERSCTFNSGTYRGAIFIVS
jgi:hypothetical protein